jgi:prepilin-type N-terminal cleavage/methylation domain-containing protein
MKRRCSGFTLIEMLIGIGMLTVVFSISGMAFAEIVRTRGAQERYLQRRDAAVHLMRLVAKQVRESSAVLPEAGGLSSNENTLILEHDGKTIAYQSEPGLVRRIQIGAAGPQEETVLKADGVSVRFNVEGAESVVITGEWIEHPRVGISRPILSLRAARRVQP